MPPKKKTDNSLAAAIIFSSIILSGSLVFFGLQLDGDGMQDEDLSAKIEEGIEAYVQNAQDEYDEQATAQQVPNLVDIEDFIDDDAMIGDPNAPVTIVEFSDYECPFCTKFYTESLPKIKSEYIDKGLVNLIYRDNPLSFHPNAYPAALAAECVRDQLGDQGYFDMHDKLFDGNSLSASTLEAYAGELGADLTEYTACMDEDRFEDEIRADINAAHSVNLTGTPSFIVNGVVIEGAQPYEVFEQVIETELAN